MADQEKRDRIAAKQRREEAFRRVDASAPLPLTQDPTPTSLDDLSAFYEADKEARAPHD